MYNYGYLAEAVELINWVEEEPPTASTTDSTHLHPTQVPCHPVSRFGKYK